MPEEVSRSGHDKNPIEVELPCDSDAHGIGRLLDRSRNADIGGCRSDLPVFQGEDCAAIGREFGAYLNDETLAIVQGPSDVDGEARSVRLKQAMTLMASLANTQLDALGLRSACDAPQFLAAAEPEFSDELRATVGDALFDGQPAATYQEWFADVERSVSVIDTEE